MKMKQLLYKTITCCAALLAFAACDKSGDLLDDETGGGSIFLDFSSGAAPAHSSRALDTSFETRVDHLDVMIFDEDGNKVWYERFEASAAAGGKLTLTAKRNTFDANTKYWVYLIANANDDEKAKFSAADFNLNKLKSMVRDNPYIHLTGMPNNTTNAAGLDLPQNFLMDGAAYLGSTGTTEPETPGPVVLNNGNAKDDTNLKVTLRRAAVKLVLKLSPQAGVIKITDPLDIAGLANTSGYYLRNMPHTTSLLGEQEHEALLRTTRQTRNHYFELHSSGADLDEPAPDPANPPRLIDGITVTAYVYAHNWTSGNNMEKEPRWIVDIPLKYNNGSKDRDVVTYEHSYYQIPVCQGTELERNTCYTVSATISSPGGTSPSKPETLTDVKFEVLQDWIPKQIPIGGDTSKPMFLTLNRTEMEMHNIDKDETTLEFASSSEVKATVTRAYYIDKFGNEQTVSDAILHAIKITPDPALNGTIKIESPVPINNTARYITVEFINDDNIKRTVEITQYPLINITNIQGWYSYRSDFGGTTWENFANPAVKRVSAYGYDEATDTWKYSATENGGNINIYNENGTWIYPWWGEPIFFISSVVTQKIEADDTVIEDEKGDKYTYDKGQSEISRYSYNKDRWDRQNQTHIPGNTRLTLPVRTLKNARMYHVEVTSSSGDYTIGRPRITDGKTDPGLDNAQLVSPSFMIASQLGAVPTSAFTNVDDDKARAMAASHCKRYVEVAENGTVYGGWRLPTSAEIGIIIDLQYNKAEGAAMDEVMNGSNYFSASGIVTNEESIHSETLRFLRCVRDAYETMETGKDAGTTTDPAAGNQ